MKPFVTGTASTKIRKRSEKVCQESGTFTCKYCPFRSTSTYNLLQHEQHHKANFGSKCSFCNYSAGNTQVIAIHMNRVHPRQKNKSTSVYKMNEGWVQPGLDNEATESSENEQMNEDLLLPPNTAQPNAIIPQKAQEEVIDITMDSDNEGSVEDPEELSCLCGRNQPVPMDSFVVDSEDQFVPLISCDECGRRFHELCVGITPADYNQIGVDGGKWLCPPCIHKETLMTYNAKLIKAVDTLAKQFPPPLDSLESSALSSQEKEAICRLKLSKLELEIQSADTTIVKVKNLKKEEDRVMQMDRSKMTNNLRKKIEDLQMKDRGKSIELSVLVEHNERFQQQLNELTARKIQLEIEIANSGEFSTAKKMKMESIALDTFTSFGEIEERIQVKKDSLSKVNEKLAATLKEDAHTRDRIRDFEKEYITNNKNLTKMQNDLDFLKENQAAVIPSATAVQLKSLKEEQYKRIETLISLQKELVQLSFSYVIYEIRQKKELLSALNNY